MSGSKQEEWLAIGWLLVASQFNSGFIYGFAIFCASISMLCSWIKAFQEAKD